MPAVGGCNMLSVVSPTMLCVVCRVSGQPSLALHWQLCQLSALPCSALPAVLVPSLVMPAVGECNMLSMITAAMLKGVCACCLTQ